MKSLFSFIAVAIIGLCSCTKDEADLRTSSFETPVVKGFIMRDPNGWIIGNIGNPNVKIGDPPNGTNSSFSVEVYPNPAVNLCHVHIISPNEDEIKQVWLTRATASDQLYNSAGILNMNALKIGGYPLFQALVSDDDVGLDLSKLEDGFYRVYVKMGGLLFYDNLVIYKNLETK